MNPPLEPSFFAPTLPNATHPEPFSGLSLLPEALTNSMQQVAGRISYRGARQAEMRVAFQRAELARKHVEADLYVEAKSMLMAPPHNQAKPTEAGINAHIHTTPALRERLDAAFEREFAAERAYEEAKAVFTAVKEEANMVAEAARSLRAEMAHLEPTVR